VPHCDEETLSLLALGEPGSTDVTESANLAAHAAQCPRCAAELAALRHVVRTARTPEPTEGADAGASEDGDEQIRAVVPPPPVWAAIAAATGVGTDPRPDEVARHAGRTASGPARRTTPADSGAAAPPPPAAPTAVAPVPRPRSQTSRLNSRLLAVAASCLVVGLIGGVVVDRVLDSGSTSDPSAPVLAATRLAGLPAAPAASGEADVVETPTGGRTLDLDVRQLGAPDGFYQVWVIDPTVTKMVPVGVLSGGQGRFVLPAGVDLADYPVVDVSLEPLDGNPAHSGKSVLRGTLR
jgi:hypothetical protein